MEEEKTIEQQLKEMQEANDEILGYGKVLKNLECDEKGEKVVVSYHFSAAPLEKIPSLIKAINGFVESAGTSEMFTEQSMDIAAEIIAISLNKFHPDMDVAKVKKAFGLTGISKAIALALDLNNFVEDMGKIQGLMPQNIVKQTTKNQRKKKA